MRFHFGFSFRLKTLKKFLFPILIGILAFFGFGGLFGFINVYAYENLGSSYVFDIPEHNFDTNFTSDSNYIDVLKYYSNYNSSYYDIISTYNYDNSEIELFLVPKNSTITKSIMGDSTHLFTYYNSNLTNYYVRIQKNLNVTFFNSNGFNTIENCLVNNVCWSSFSQSSPFTFSKNTTTSNLSFTIFTYNEDVNNSDSVIFDELTFKKYIYSSQSNIINNYDDYNTNFYVKYLIMNGNGIPDDSTIPSYIDLYPDYVETKYEFINNVYIGSIIPSDLSSLNLSFSFNYDYLQNFNSESLYIYYFGRIDNSTYYSYEPLNCIFTPSNFTIDSSRKYVEGNLFNNSISCSETLTNYDGIYIYIDFFPNSKNVVSNVKLNTSKGNLTTHNSNAKGLFIYEKFTSLPSNYQMIISSKKYTSNIYYESFNEFSGTSAEENFTILSYITKLDIDIDSRNINPLMIGRYNGTNGIIFNNAKLYSGTTDLNLFFDYESILSICNGGSCTYYDDIGQVTTNIIDNDLIIMSNNNYDISHYFNQIVEYIDSISSNLDNIKVVVNDWYNSLPLSFSAFIFFIFNLSCIYLIFKTIIKF